MITIKNNIHSGDALPQFGYIEGRGFFGRAVMRLTRWLRAVNVERYMDIKNQSADRDFGGRHLDIGCGDGYFLRRSVAFERYGLDKELGDKVDEGLDFPDSYFDVVTMLAVIEHISDPIPLLNEIHRVLVPGGKFILTTPKKSAELFISLYARDIEEEHEVYYTPEKINQLAKGRFEPSGSDTFCLGLNQVFCLRKI